MKVAIVIESSLIVVLLVLVGYLYHRNTNSDRVSDKCLLGLSRADRNIFMGDLNEYAKQNINMCSKNGRVTDRDYAMYSFILAEKYGDPFAAQQFADCILLNDSLNKDSVWISIIFPYLKYAADTLLDDAPLSSYSAASGMAELCSGYANFMPVDSAKYLFYKRRAEQALRTFYKGPDN
jgi:hypothetical protein